MAGGEWLDMIRELNFTKFDKFRKTQRILYVHALLNDMQYTCLIENC